MYIKSAIDGVSLKELNQFRRKIKIGMKVKLQLPGLLDANKMDIVNAKVISKYMSFVEVEGQRRQRIIKRTLHYIDLYNFYISKEPILMK